MFRWFSTVSPSHKGPLRCVHFLPFAHPALLARGACHPTSCHSLPVSFPPSPLPLSFLLSPLLCPAAAKTEEGSAYALSVRRKDAPRLPPYIRKPRHGSSQGPDTVVSLKMPTMLSFFLKIFSVVWETQQNKPNKSQLGGPFTHQHNFPEPERCPVAKGHPTSQPPFIPKPHSQVPSERQNQVHAEV